MTAESQLFIKELCETPVFTYAKSFFKNRALKKFFFRVKYYLVMNFPEEFGTKTGEGEKNAIWGVASSLYILR